MGYNISLLGEKEGFEKRIIFASRIEEDEIRKKFEAFRAKCTGVAKEHLPFRCPIKKADEPGKFELFFDDRNLSYNFDLLMEFLGEIVGEGMVKAAKAMDGGRIGATAFAVTPGCSMRFEFFPVQDLLGRVQRGELSFADVLKNSDGVTFKEYTAKYS